MNFRNRCAINEYDVHFADILPRDLRKYGSRRIEGLTSFMNDTVKTHVVLAGGETYLCSMNAALEMFNPKFPVPEFATCEWKNWVSQFRIAYLVKKSLFSNPGSFAANTIGLDRWNNEAEEILAGYEYVSTRNYPGRESKIFAPDSVITVNELFREKILGRGRPHTFKYIAVQFRRSTRINEIANQLAMIVKATKLGVIFFRAGVCYTTDELIPYLRVRKEMADLGVHDNISIFRKLNIWDISSLIANAELVIGTSLHVRIVSFAFSVPRVTFDVENENKHRSMIGGWDFGAMACNMSSTKKDQIFQTAMATMNCHEFKNAEHTQKAVKMYMENFQAMIKAMKICTTI